VKDGQKFAVTPLRIFRMPDGDFRLARRLYPTIFAFRVPLLGRKIALRQVKAYIPAGRSHGTASLTPGRHAHNAVMILKPASSTVWSAAQRRGFRVCTGLFWRAIFAAFCGTGERASPCSTTTSLMSIGDEPVGVLMRAWRCADAIICGGALSGSEKVQIHIPSDQWPNSEYRTLL
jgi:hypothetical protein